MIWKRKLNEKTIKKSIEPVSGGGGQPQLEAKVSVFKRLTRLLRHFISRQAQPNNYIPRNDEKSPCLKKRFFASLRMTGAVLKNDAFTLAEVLITLEIIGIVAALTIPSLIAKYQEKEIIIAVKKFCASGDKSCTPNVYNYFDVRAQSNWGKSDIWNATYAILADASTIRYGSNSSCGIVNGLTKPLQHICGELSVDVNGNKKPNQMGKDVFYFYVTKYGMVPFGSKEETRNQVDGIRYLVNAIRLG